MVGLQIADGPLGMEFGGNNYRRQRVCALQLEQWVIPVRCWWRRRKKRDLEPAGIHRDVVAVELKEPEMDEVIRRLRIAELSCSGYDLLHLEFQPRKAVALGFRVA